MKSKSITLLTLLIVLFTGRIARGQDCDYYPFKKGAVMAFQSLDEKGRLTGSSRLTINDIQLSGGVSEYFVKNETFDSKNKLQNSLEYSMKCENGEFSIDMRSMIDPKSMEGFKDLEVSISGSDMTFPAVLVPGQSLPDADITIGTSSGGMSLMNLSVKVTNRKVVGVEPVTVPAGTFECFKLTYDVETKLGLKISSSAVQWMSKGVGSIKTESYDKRGKLLGTTVLSEFNP